ncbi:MAG: DUF1573 domain-containing protein [Candidatus Paceibacterota bacterium]|jgi:hypothetical protein
MNKGILAVVLITVSLLGLMWWGSNIQKTAGAITGKTSVLFADEKSYDFGTISMANGDVTKDFVIKNVTNKDINIPSLVTSCMCTTAFIVKPDKTVKGPFGMPGMGYVPPANEVIKPGEGRVIRIVYDPNAHGPAGVGRIDRFATITDEYGGEFQLEIKATVTP